MMKKIITILMALVLILPSVPVLAAQSQITSGGKTAAYDTITVNINGKKQALTGTPAYLNNGNALVPSKEIFGSKLVGVKMAYAAKNKRIAFSYGTHKVYMTLGSKNAIVDGVKKVMPIAPQSVTYKSSKKTKIVVPSRFTAEALGITYNWDAQKQIVSITVKTPTTSSDDKGTGTGTNTTTGIKLYYNGKTTLYNKRPVTIYVGKSKVKSQMPGIILEDTTMVPAYPTFSTSNMKATYSFNKKTNSLTITKRANTVVMKLGSNTAIVNGKSSRMPTMPVLVKHMGIKKSYIMIPAEFTAKALGYVYSYNQTSATAKITYKTGTTTPPVVPPVTDPSTEPDEPDTTDPTVPSTDEVKAMWISYLEFGRTAKSQTQMQTKVDTMFDKCVEYGMNTVIVQVRPFSDALYPSQYFPWSAYVSGQQGKEVSYDPLAYMVEAAHKRNLKIEAWLNPYRVTNGSEGADGITSLSDDNPAKIWYQSTDKAENRNVLLYNKMFYYNPAKKEVQDLILNGIKEIVTNYDVDGIHFDDYFYPSFNAANVNTQFDAAEYQAYVDANTQTNKQSLSIADWRRNNVSTLVKNAYSAIKKIKPAVKFGISPAGNLNNLRSDLQYFTDVDLWMKTPGYIDYICPQIYWGFNDTINYDDVLNKWIIANNSNIVDLYAGIPVYKAGSTVSAEWSSSEDILKRQVEYARKSTSVKGFMFFSYNSFGTTAAKKEVNNLLPLLKDK